MHYVLFPIKSKVFYFRYKVVRIFISMLYLYSIVKIYHKCLQKAHMESMLQKEISVFWLTFCCEAFDIPKA